MTNDENLSPHDPANNRFSRWLNRVFDRPWKIVAWLVFCAVAVWALRAFRVSWIFG